MVECVLRLLFDDRTLGVKSQYLGVQCQPFMLSQLEATRDWLVPHLQRTAECIEQDSKEEQGAPAVKAAGIEGQVVEDASDNQCHDKVSDRA